MCSAFDLKKTVHGLKVSCPSVWEWNIGPIKLALLEAGDLLGKPLPVILQLHCGSNFRILGHHLSTFYQFSDLSPLPREAGHPLSLPRALVFCTALNRSPSLHCMCLCPLVHYFRISGPEEQNLLIFHPAKPPRAQRVPQGILTNKKIVNWMNE